LLQPKDHSDQDPRADSFVNHPTTSDTIVILVALMQALGFLALVVVRWRFLELGRPHGQPGHIHIPTYRFVMPVAQSIAWVSTLSGSLFSLYTCFFFVVKASQMSLSNEKSWPNSMFLTYFLSFCSYTVLPR
jgi:hypothetical protein